MGYHRPGPWTLLAAFLVGIGHTVAGAAVRSALFGPPAGSVLDVYVALGLFLVGALVTVLWRTDGLVGPGLTVALLFAVTAVGSWRQVTAPPVVVGPTPFGWYGIGWFVVLGTALAVGLVERRLRGAGASVAAGEDEAAKR